MRERFKGKDIDLIIDAGFSTCLPALPKGIYEKLEKDCLKFGILQPLIAWNQKDLAGGYPLVDGHNRYKIAKKNNLSYDVVLLPFNDYSEALFWIVDSQEARRNIDKIGLSEVRGRLYKLLKLPHGGDRKSQGFESDLESRGNDYPLIFDQDAVGSTAEMIGNAYNVTEKTIKNDEALVNAIDQIKELDADFYEKIANREVTSKKAILDRSNELREAKENVGNIGKPKNLKSKTDITRSHDKALAVVDALAEGSWVYDIVAQHYPPKRGKTYKSTMFDYVTEVSVREQGNKVSRNGELYEGTVRHVIDVVFVIKPNTKIVRPLKIGVEIKVDKHDYFNNFHKKVDKYAKYCDAFYLCVTRDILQDINVGRLNDIGLLVVDNEEVIVHELGVINPIPQSLELELINEILVKNIKKRYYE